MNWTDLLPIINPRHSARVIVVAFCVCASVTTYSLTTHGFKPNKVYQKIQRDVGTIKKAIFVKMFRSKGMT